MLNSKFVVVFVASYVQDTSYTQCKCTVVLSSCSCVRLDYGLIKLKGKRKISILIWIRVYNFLTGGCWLGCDLNDFSQASLLTSKKLQQLEALSILVTINLRSLLTRLATTGYMVQGTGLVWFRMIKHCRQALRGLQTRPCSHQPGQI